MADTTKPQNAKTRRLDRMRANPAADWSMDDVVSLCREHTIRCSPPSGGGSHWKVSIPRDVIF